MINLESGSLMKYHFLILPALVLSFQSFAATDKDNTEINKRDRAASELTADQQTSSNSDMDVTRRIRQFIMKEPNLSTYAKNVKIITVGGKVTLKGPVRTEQELGIIMKHARKVAGATNVKNQMVVEKAQ